MATRKTSVEIQHTPIKGLTLGGLWKAAGIVAFAAWVYFSLVGRINDAQRVSQDNNGILREMQSDRKEYDRVNNIRLTNIELDQREAKIRLTTIENQIKQ